MAQTLAHEIIYGTSEGVERIIASGADVNEIDAYGFTPLIESAIVNNVDMANLLLQHGAKIDEPDMLGRTALHWAVDNHNIELVKLLLKNQANPNAYTIAGQPVLVYPLLRKQQDLKELLYQYGANLKFAQDYINTKLIGHRFELAGHVHAVTNKGNLIPVDLEGFYLGVTLDIIQDSLSRYKNNFGARHLRAYFNYLQKIIKAFVNASHLLKYQHYLINAERYKDDINKLLNADLLLIPVAHEGHALTFIKYHDYLVRCDRGEQGLIDGTVVVYKINRPQLLTADFIMNLVYHRQPKDFIYQEINEILGLTKVIDLPLSPQVSGNCSWANVEACVPAMLFLLMLSEKQIGSNLRICQNTAFSIYQQWLEWDKDRTLYDCVQSFTQANKSRKATKAALLAALLFQRCNSHVPKDLERAEKILSVLTIPEYDYVLKSYLKSYTKDKNNSFGKNLLELIEFCNVHPGFNVHDL